MIDAEPSLKASLIHQTERAIDGLRKRRDDIEPELAEINREIDEARELLQLLKTGAVSMPIKQKKKPINESYAREVLDALDSEFTTHDFAEAAEISNSAASVWLKRFMGSNLLTRKLLGRGKQPSIWVKNG
jgi:response regulator of citrate/malate metabolism